MNDRKKFLESRIIGKVKIHIDGSALMRGCQLTWVDVSALSSVAASWLSSVVKNWFAC